MRYRYKSYKVNPRIRWNCLKYNSLKKSKVCHGDMFKWILFWKFYWKLFEANDRAVKKMVDYIRRYSHV